MSVRVRRPYAARRRHDEQVSALAGLQLTSIVGVQPAQLAAKRSPEIPERA
jgi:hypothetical protein